ncbi:MAG: membrane protease YdiL (CAAX protease family) [Planctomycetota bacterium]
MGKYTGSQPAVPKGTCPSCMTTGNGDLRFCTKCGYKLIGNTQQLARSSKNSVLAIAVIFVGVLVTLIVSSLLSPAEPSSHVSYIGSALAMSTGFAVFGAIGVKLLGKGALEQSFAGPCSPRDFGLGLLAGVLSLLISFAYVWALIQLFDGGDSAGATDVFLEPAFVPSLFAMLLVSAVFPAVVEEWLNRGVLWVALSRITRPPVVIFCTAIVFAFMHGLNGLGPFELPHRFVGGLLLGWVRHKTGSLVPVIAGHGLLNSLAIAIDYYA